MVSRLSLPVLKRLLMYQVFCKASPTRLPAILLLAGFLAFIAFGIPPVLAGDTPVPCHSPRITSIDAPDSTDLFGQHEIRAAVTGCYDCSYNWVIESDNCTRRLDTRTTPTFRKSFPVPGPYTIRLRVTERSTGQQCTGYSNTAEMTKRVTVAGPYRGVNGACCKPENVMVRQSRETTDLSASQGPVTFIGTDPTCRDCRFSWLGTRVPTTGAASNYVFDPSSTVFTNAEMFGIPYVSMDHRFSQPGIYTVMAKVNNPPSCDYIDSIADDSGYGFVTHSVTGSGIGVNGRCDPMGTVSILSGMETVDLGSNSVEPYWVAYSSFSCIGCTYNWTILKISDAGRIPVPLANDDIFEKGGRPGLKHWFSETGFYSIYLHVYPPSQCPVNPTTNSYAVSSASIRVTDLYRPGGTAPGSGGVEEYQTVMPANNLDVPPIHVAPDLTVIPPTDVPDPVYYSAPDKAGYEKESIQEITPEETMNPDKYAKEGTGLSEPSYEITNAPDEYTSKMKGLSTSMAKVVPGFELPLVLCAGLIVLVLRRK